MADEAVYGLDLYSVGFAVIYSVAIEAAAASLMNQIESDLFHRLPEAEP